MFGDKRDRAFHDAPLAILALGQGLIGKYLSWGRQLQAIFYRKLKRKIADKKAAAIVAFCPEGVKAGPRYFNKAVKIEGHIGIPRSCRQIEIGHHSGVMDGDLLKIGEPFPVSFVIGIIQPIDPMGGGVVSCRRPKQG